MRKFAVRTLLGVAAASALWFACSDDNPVSPAPAAFDILYVLNQADQTIYKYNAQTLVRIDSLSTPVVEPHFIEFSRDHSCYYVIGRQVGGQIAKYRTADDSLLQLVTVPGTVFPTALAISPNDDTVYVCDFSDTKGRIHRYAASGNNFAYLDSSLQAGYQTHDLHFAASGEFFVSAGFNSDDITIVNLDSGSTTPLLVQDASTGFGTPPAGYGPYGVRVDNASELAIVACRKGVDQIRVIDLLTRQLVDSIVIPTADQTSSAMAGPTMMHVAPDNDIVYVTGFTDNRVWVVRLSTASVVQTIPLGTARPFMVMADQSGDRVYVSTTGFRPDNGTLYVIDGQSYQVIDSVAAGSEPFGFSILHRQGAHH